MAATAFTLLAGAPLRVATRMRPAGASERLGPAGCLSLTQPPPATPGRALAVVPRAGKCGCGKVRAALRASTGIALFAFTYATTDPGPAEELRREPRCGRKEGVRLRQDERGGRVRRKLAWLPPALTPRQLVRRQPRQEDVRLRQDRVGQGGAAHASGPAPVARSDAFSVLRRKPRQQVEPFLSFCAVPSIQSGPCVSTSGT